MRKLSKPVTIRLWDVEDTDFTLKVRNNPDLMKWFRQDAPITRIRQEWFIRFSPINSYRGYIVLKGKTPVGIVSLVGFDDSREFGIAILPEYQRQGIATKAMHLLIKEANPLCHTIWSEVFVTNPALSFYLYKCGFKAVSVKERAYHKQNHGLVDVVKIERYV